MYIVWSFFVVATVSNTLISHVSCEATFGDGCVQAHNALRKKHVGTNEVIRSTMLEEFARQYAEQLLLRDSSVVIHPTRTLPKRKRRNLENGIDETKHLEMWDGDIYYPSSKDGWLEAKNRFVTPQMGRSIHKICCTDNEEFSQCPKEFFHGLSFPPTGEGVTNDLYNEEEKYYDYTSGKTKTIYSHIDHFAKIVWKNTSVVGCAQSERSDDFCYFTVILYQREGAVGDPENYMLNIGNRVVPETGGMKSATRIIIIVFIIGIIIALIVLIYCCRHKIGEKYKATIINIDVLKAEQELETDSTNFWWTRPIKSSVKATTSAKPPLDEYEYVPEKSSDAVDRVTPVRPPSFSKARQPSLKNIPRRPAPPVGVRQQPSFSEVVNKYRGITLKRSDYEQLKLNKLPSLCDFVDVMGKPSAPPSRPSAPPGPRNRVVIQEPSGKSAPPPVPRDSSEAPKAPSRPPPQPSDSSHTTPVEKPRPAARKLPLSPADSSGPSGKKPMLPSKPLPKPPPGTETADVEEERPLSIAERRKLLEEGKK